MLEYYLKSLKLPTFIKRHKEVAEQCRSQGEDYQQFLLRLSEMEVLGRQNRMVQQKIKKAHFPVLKTLDSFDFKVLPDLDQRQVCELSQCTYTHPE